MALGIYSDNEIDKGNGRLIPFVMFSFRLSFPHLIYQYHACCQPLSTRGFHWPIEGLVISVFVVNFVYRDKFYQHGKSNVKKHPTRGDLEMVISYHLKLKGACAQCHRVIGDSNVLGHAEPQEILVLS